MPVPRMSLGSSTSLAAIGVHNDSALTQLSCWHRLRLLFCSKRLARPDAGAEDEPRFLHVLRSHWFAFLLALSQNTYAATDSDECHTATSAVFN